MSFYDTIPAAGVAAINRAAGRGGLAAATAFSRHGSGIGLADRPLSELDEATEAVAKAGQAKTAATAMPADGPDAAAVIERAEPAFATGPVPVRRNSAGIARAPNPFSHAGNWWRRIAVILFRAISGIQAVTRRMTDANRSSAMIGTGSKHGISMPSGPAGSNGSKAGVQLETRMLAQELKEAAALVSSGHVGPEFSDTGIITSFLSEKLDAALTSEDAAEHLFGRVSVGDLSAWHPGDAGTREMAARRWMGEFPDILENRPACPDGISILQHPAPRTQTVSSHTQPAR